MMKPSLFIGSSVEGLSAAYSIQQNLSHDAEATVWGQGVFELSKTTMESLNEALNSSDFGVFVFSPDDNVSMRGEQKKAVRDNVLFELGLFIGKLGRERVFFILPENSEIHIPTDLMGVTGGTYDPNRFDGNLQAATGIVCNQIRTQIKKLGSLRAVTAADEGGTSEKKETTSTDDWLIDASNGEYELAKTKLQKTLNNKKDDERLKDCAWIAYMDLHLDPTNGITALRSVFESNPNNETIFDLIPRMFLYADYPSIASELALAALDSFPDDKSIVYNLADCYKADYEYEKAVSLLLSHSFRDHPRLAILLSEIHEQENEKEKALSALYSAYIKNPTHEELTYRLARQLQDNDLDKEALSLFYYLSEKPEATSSYWGYLSNSCVALDLYDKAMTAAKKAEELSKSKEAWILNNIGNMLNNKGLFGESISWLKKGIELGIDSTYAHDRLAKAIKNKEDENLKFLEYVKEGRKLIKSLNPYSEPKEPLTE